MQEERKPLLIKYLICFGVAALIAFVVVWINGFFTESMSVNIQILADAFFVPGILFTLFAGMLYISGEGGLLGIGFVLKSVAQIFTPMGRKYHETYAQYRERKLGEKKKGSDRCILITGLIFLAIGIVLTVIWDLKVS